MDRRNFITLVVLLLLASTWTSHNVYGDVTPDQTDMPQQYLEKPKIKMQVRILNNFKNNLDATLTLIYQSTRATRLRWFKQERNMQLQGSEVPGYFPIDGDPKYWVEYLRSHDMTSATLHIRNYQFEESDSYETIITTDDDRVQYNIRTSIESEIGHLHHYINSPEWTRCPEDVVFEDDGSFQVGCRAIVPFEFPPSKTTFGSRYLPEEYNSYNQMYMNRIMGQLLIDEPKDHVVMINQGINPHMLMNISEQIGGNHTVVSYFRRPTKYSHVIYDANLTTTNASSELEGIYQCEMLRRYKGTEPFEKSYINSYVRRKGHESVYLSPSISNALKTIVKPCDYDEDSDENKVSENLQVQMISGQKFCIRCIAMGYPKPTIRLVYKVSSKYKRKHNMQGNFKEVNLRAKNILALESVNVADGGIQETTFVFMNPNPGIHNNVYRCCGRNAGGRSDSEFTVKVS